MKKVMLVIGFMSLMFSCNAQSSNKVPKDIKIPKSMQTKTATFGAGCFWCVEAVFQELKGVYTVESGYTGGDSKKPTYRQVSSGTSGFAEVAQITYDPNVISFEKLLAVFFKTHDPTTLNRQGADKGTQYRSAIFYHNDSQKESALNIIDQLNQEQAYPNPIVTEITQLGLYYKAEKYHQDYYNNNPSQGYCVYVIQPKLEKFRKVFKQYLKEDNLEK